MLLKQSKKTRLWPIALLLFLVGLSIMGAAGMVTGLPKDGMAFSLAGFSANGAHGKSVHHTIAHVKTTRGQKTHSKTVTATSATSTFWMQTMDSCQQAIPGASFVMQGPNFDVAAGPGPGVKPVTVASSQGHCPLQRGNCVTVPTGCVSWAVPIPASGSVTYTVTETSSPSAYVPCTGGSVCTGGPVVTTLVIDSTGAISATVFNVYPDGKSVTWPTSGAAYTGTSTDPAVVHNFGLGTGSCDNDSDADDHLTGAPSSHCDNDKDR